MPPPPLTVAETDVESPPLVDYRVVPLGSVAPSASGLPTLALTDGNGEVRPLDEIETEVIRFAIAHYRGQMSEVARRLQIGRSTLYRKFDSLGLDHDCPNSDMDSVVTG